jgi:hypothetical protein
VANWWRLQNFNQMSVGTEVSSSNSQPDKSFSACEVFGCSTWLRRIKRFRDLDWRIGDDDTANYRLETQEKASDAKMHFKLKYLLIPPGKCISMVFQSYQLTFYTRDRLHMPHINTMVKSSKESTLLNFLSPGPKGNLLWLFLASAYSRLILHKMSIHD